MANVVDLRVASEIILECNEVSSVIETDGRKRADKIAENKFPRPSARGGRTVIGHSLLSPYDITLTRVLLLDILNEIHLDRYT